uniref:Uncharacterized protein n=1 Tax=Zea mays TaxID=4577 RepID=C0PM17_MAIZE|nr:unknown [Zea mays]
MNQLLICFSCRPVSSTSLALSSSVGYGHLECSCHHCLRMLVVSPGSFPALLFLRISSRTSSILDLKPCLSSILSSCLTLSMSERSESVGMSGPKPIMSCPSEPISRPTSSIGASSSSSDMVAPVPSSSVAPVRSCRDCSISRHAMTASTACTRTCCCSCSRNEHSSIRYCARNESRSCLSCGERKGRWWAA